MAGLLQQPPTGEQIKNWWTTNKVGQGGMKDSDIADAMDKFGVTAKQVGDAVGYDSAKIQSRYDAVRKPATGTTTGTTTGAAAGTTTSTTGAAAGTTTSTTAGGPAITTTPAPAASTVALAKMGKSESSAARVADIINQDSELIQIAGTRGKQAANARGLLNSSLAAESSQAAVLDKASALGMQDAETSAAFELSNQKEMNEAARLAQTGAQGLEAIRTQGTVESGLIKERGQIDKDLQGADAATRVKLLERQGVIDKELQAARGQIDKDLQGADAATRAILLERQGAIDANLQELRSRQNLEAISKQGTVESILLQERGRIDAALQTADAASRVALLERQGQIDQSLQDSRDRQEFIMQNLRGEQSKDLADIQGKYETLAATNQSAGIAMQNHSIALAEILGNENIPAEQKQGLVDKQLSLMKLQLDVIGGINNLDLAGLLSWDAPTTPAAGATAVPGTPTPEEYAGSATEYLR
jgi:hypothetical protein